MSDDDIPTPAVTELMLLKKQHPGFTITCDVCGSRRIEIKNTLGWSELSGSWGSVDLSCLDCKSSVSIAEGE